MSTNTPNDDDRTRIQESVPEKTHQQRPCAVTALQTLATMIMIAVNHQESYLVQSTTPARVHHKSGADLESLPAFNISLSWTPPAAPYNCHIAVMENIGFGITPHISHRCPDTSCPTHPRAAPTQHLYPAQIPSLAIKQQDQAAYGGALAGVNDLWRLGCNPLESYPKVLPASYTIMMMGGVMLLMVRPDLWAACHAGACGPRAREKSHMRQRGRRAQGALGCGGTRRGGGRRRRRAGDLHRDEGGHAMKQREPLSSTKCPAPAHKLAFVILRTSIDG
ncbi:hypothetical protein BV22DRAFT_1052703, partial [Leucogyrophana mollusca]